MIYPLFVYAKGDFFIAMKLITISNQLADELQALDSEFLLNKNGRPCVLVIRLKYAGRRQDFAIPLRSNIPPAEQKANYFPLPPRATTKPHHRHGLHFVKMFPITKGHTQKFHTDNNAEYKRINNILDKNTRQIVAQAQAYLTAYEQGNRSLYATNIDKLLDYISK